MQFIFIALSFAVFCNKLFYTLLFLSFFSISCFSFAENKSDNQVIEIDESLIGKQEPTVAKGEELLVINQGSSENTDDQIEEKVDNVEDNVNKNQSMSATEIFEEQIEKARNVSDIKSSGNKIKYGSELADRIEQENLNSMDKKISVNRTIMKKNGPVKFDIKVSDSSKTKTGTSIKNIQSAYESYMSGDYELAILFYKKALQDNPDSVEAQFGLAVSYQMLMQFNQAINCYLAMLNKNYSRKKIVNNLLLALSYLSYSDALDILLTIDDNIAGYSDVLSQIGILYMRLGDNAKAISALTKAYELAPTNAIICYNLGILYDRSGNIDYAKHFWDMAIKNDISNVLSQEDIDIFQKRLKEIDETIVKETKKEK